MAPRTPVSYLVVEGRNDLHVISALCSRHQIPETFRIVPPNDETTGVDELLESIPIWMRAPGLRTLGFVIDADTDIQARWQSVSHRLQTSGYTHIPQQPDPLGTILEHHQLPRIGIWLMPDNRLSGILEDFVARLVPQNDALLPKAESILMEIDQENLRRYSLVHHPKALIHTWLAWQDTPGLPMGLSITARVLAHNSPIAITFVDWLNRLFNQPIP